MNGFPKPDPTPMFAATLAKSGMMRAGLQRQSDLLSAYSQLPPQTQSFDAAQTNKEAAELGMENFQRSQEFERLINPQIAQMRGELGSKVAEATNLNASKQWMDQWSLKHGLMGGSGLGTDSLIGRSAIYDQATQEGRQAKLQNLAIQQGYLAQTPAPIGGLDPASIIAAEQAAKVQNLQSMQQWQGNVMKGAQGLNQSTTDWINSGLGELQNVNQVAAQNQQNYQQMMYENAAQKAASSNAMTGQMIGAGGAVAGAAIGAAIII